MSTKPSAKAKSLRERRASERSAHSAEQRLYEKCKENQRLQEESRQYRKLLRDFLSLRADTKLPRRSSIVSTASSPKSPELLFLRGEVAGLRQRLRDKMTRETSSTLLQEGLGIARESLAEIQQLQEPTTTRGAEKHISQQSPSPTDHSAIGQKALRAALEEARKSEAGLRDRVQSAEEMLASFKRENENRDLIMKSMAAQLEIRDEQIRRLEASTDDIDKLRESIEVRNLEEAVVSLQEQVVELSERLEAYRQEYDE